MKNSRQLDTPEPCDSVIITVRLPDASVYNCQLTLEDVAKAVQQDYFNYPGARAEAEVRQNEALT